MILRIVGVIHRDPLHRQRLEDYFVHCRESGCENPCFLATEWDEETFSKVKAQREVIRTLLKGKWPQASEDLINKIMLTLAFEGDTHTKIYPQVEILWLDQGRQDERPGESGKGFAISLGVTTELYKLSIDDSNFLQKLSEAILCETPGPTGEDERDGKWAHLILNRITQCDDGWAIVIVGKNHAGETEGSMRRLLEAAGQQCEVFFL